MKRFVSNSLKLLAGCMVGLATPTCFGLTSCSNADAIEFANYESYMSEDLMNDLQSKYSIHFPNYTVAEMIPAKFEKFYDCAVPCGYELMALLRKGWLEKIDWSKFEVTDQSGQPITNATEARRLFVAEEYYDGLEKMNTQFAQYILLPGNEDMIKYLEPDGKTFNILNYGVPYFAQSFMFAYTGTEIQFYHQNGDKAEKTDSPTWADIFYTISPANPNQDERFKHKKIGMVDDARSFHDVARIVESIEDKEEEITLDPIENASIDRVQHTMSHITSKFAGHQGSFVLNSDSAIVSRGLADRKGDQTAVLSWSGDTIYAAQGAEEFEAFTHENFHIQKAAERTFDEIEFVVINNKNEKNPNKLKNIYSVIKQVCLDGCDQDTDGICEKEDDRYKYWAMDNWDTVMYTPMLRSIYGAVAILPNTKYWEEQMEEYGYSEETIDKLFIPILNGKGLHAGDEHLYGKTLTPHQNSNNHWAWLQQRGNL